jgi:hypothetical protein
VPEDELRRIFNDGDYYGRACRNELLTSVEAERPAPPSAGQPPGTMSRVVVYYDLPSLRRVALVHEYRLPDGTLGASGRPDPKRILLEGEILICSPPRPPQRASNPAT